jgi:metal-dependent amidase/aminoacylase/carboxypeptidase family protein
MPETCVFSGTIRDYSPEIYERVEGRLQQTVNGIAASMDVEAEVEFGASYPATVNHATNA